MIERECDRPFGYLGKRAIALLEEKGDSLRDSYASRTLKQQQLRYAQDTIRLL